MLVALRLAGRVRPTLATHTSLPARHFLPLTPSVSVFKKPPQVLSYFQQHLFCSEKRDRSKTKICSVEGVEERKSSSDRKSKGKGKEKPPTKKKSQSHCSSKKDEQGTKERLKTLMCDETQNKFKEDTKKLEVNKAWDEIEKADKFKDDTKQVEVYEACDEIEKPVILKEDTKKEEVKETCDEIEKNAEDKDEQSSSESSSSSECSSDSESSSEEEDSRPPYKECDGKNDLEAEEEKKIDGKAVTEMCDCIKSAVAKAFDEKKGTGFGKAGRCEEKHIKPTTCNAIQSENLDSKPKLSRHIQCCKPEMSKSAVSSENQPSGPEKCKAFKREEAMKKVSAEVKEVKQEHKNPVCECIRNVLNKTCKPTEKLEENSTKKESGDKGCSESDIKPDSKMEEKSASEHQEESHKKPGKNLRKTNESCQRGEITSNIKKNEPKKSESGKEEKAIPEAKMNKQTIITGPKPFRGKKDCNKKKPVTKCT